jgi:hypothetical protein
MPQFLRNLYLDGYKGVEKIEAPIRQQIDNKLLNGPYQFAQDLYTAETNPNGPRILLYKNLPKLYNTDLIRIESGGSIDPARTMAVRGTRYNDPEKKGKMGFNLGNLFGGSANRPSDTIFESKTGAPISKGTQPVNGDWSGLKYAVEEGKDYLVSQAPMDSNFLTGLLKGNTTDIAQNVVGKAADAVANAVRKGAVKLLTGKRKKGKSTYESNALFDEPNTYKKQNSEYFKTYLAAEGFLKRTEQKVIDWDDINTNLLNTTTFTKTDLDKVIEKNLKTSVAYIQFQANNADKYLVFPAAIGDITENIQPEWGNFRYVGSPFKVYRYAGVQRELKFDFKVYWLDTNSGGTSEKTGTNQMYVMSKKLEELRKLAFPQEKLAAIKLGGVSNYAPLAFTPNIIKFSLGNLYKNLNCIITSMDMQIDNDVSWASDDPFFTTAGSETITYPTMVNVSMGLTILETHTIDGTTATITYNMDTLSKTEQKKAENKTLSTAEDFAKWTKDHSLKS